MWKNNQGDCLVIPPVDELYKKIINIWHNHYGAEYPERDKMIRRI